MAVFAGFLVLVGAFMIFLATEVLEDAFFIGAVFSRFTRRAPYWMRGGLVLMIAGAALVVLGISLLRLAG